MIIILQSLFNSFEPGKFNVKTNMMISLAIILLQIILTFLGYIFENTIVKSCFKSKGNKELKIEKLKEDVFSEIEYARNELRFGLKILFWAFIISIVFCMFVTRDIIITAIIGLIGILFYIYADYVPHSRYYAEKYDRQTSGEKSGNAIQGLAKIYLYEYEQSRFNFEDRFYSDNDVPHKAQDVLFVKTFCWSYINGLNDKYTIKSISALILSIITMFPNAYEELIYPFGHNSNIYRIMLIFMNIVVCVYFLINMLKLESGYEKNQDVISTVFSKIEEGQESLIDYYNDELLKKDNANIYYVRSRFMYTMKRLDDMSDINAVPIEYRMLFNHKHIANLPRLNYTIMLCLFIVILLMIKFNGISFLLIVPVVIAIITYLFFRFFVLPNLGKKRLSKECQKFL